MAQFVILGFHQPLHISKTVKCSKDTKFYIMTVQSTLHSTPTKICKVYTVIGVIYSLVSSFFARHSPAGTYRLEIISTVLFNCGIAHKNLTKQD